LRRYEELRKKMVEYQIKARGVTNPRVLKAMMKVKREDFVLPEYRNEAYEDHPLPIGKSQTISQPYMVALMTECMDLKGDEKVLEIGTGSGYQTAILAELASEIYSIERIEALKNFAENNLKKAGIKNVKLFVGDGTKGLSDYAPYDAIMVTAAAKEVPEPLLKQLKIGGRLVIPAGSMFMQILKVIEKQSEKNGKIVYKERSICGCVFVPLIGEFGF